MNSHIVTNNFHVSREMPKIMVLRCIIFLTRQPSVIQVPFIDLKMYVIKLPTISA
jgi:hypothetical protein